MDKKFRPAEIEEKIYKKWEKSGAFTPKVDPQKKAFSIVIPPPNANAPLHVGHALFVTLQDIMTRYHRMKGDSTLWLPGADHAGILTQVVYERKLAQEGKTRQDLGRERFYQETYAFTQRNKKAMYNQLRILGASCDWTREKFTLDPQISETVLETFVKLHKDGLTYRGERLVSWCPRCETALSNLEVEHEDKKDSLWFIKYPLVNSEGFITVATTRPETMLGDTAVAVNPKDRRYKGRGGGKVVLPLVNREIPIIADESVDPEFGTGAVKVTPAHDPDDYEMGKRHKLSSVTVIGFDDRMTKEAGEYSGMDKKKARAKIIRDLKEQDLLEKVTSHPRSVGVCERCRTVIEPLVSLQWFIRTKPLAEPAMKAVKQGGIKILPKRFEKTYFHWMEKIEDWCVSRQLWWGHRMPIWYCGAKGLSELQRSMNPALAKEGQGCGEVMVQLEKPKKCPRCGKANIIQDPDTFDTWFSSAQWPCATLGFRWDGPPGRDFKYFYPTSVLETGYEILFFWVARMIMMGLYSTGKVPFRVVYLHGLVRDAFGQKMSKSKGNAIDPLGVVEEYGADALRMALIWGVGAGNDSKLGEERIQGMRNFANKIWNVGRFTYLARGEKQKVKSKIVSGTPSAVGLKPADKEILEELGQLVKKVTKDLDNFRFSPAGETLYQFIWHRLADVYIEEVKDRLKEGDLAARETLYEVVTTCLKLLHPFMPFVTETLWKNLGEKELLITSPWPIG